MKRLDLEIQFGDLMWRVSSEIDLEIQDGDSIWRFNFSKVLAMTIENFSVIISGSLQLLAAWGTAKLQWET